MTADRARSPRPPRRPRPPRPSPSAVDTSSCARSSARSRSVAAMAAPSNPRSTARPSGVTHTWLRSRLRWAMRSQVQRLAPGATRRRRAPGRAGPGRPRTAAARRLVDRRRVAVGRALRTQDAPPPPRPGRPRRGPRAGRPSRGAMRRCPARWRRGRRRRPPCAGPAPRARCVAARCRTAVVDPGAQPHRPPELLEHVLGAVVHRAHPHLQRWRRRPSRPRTRAGQLPGSCSIRRGAPGGAQHRHQLGGLGVGALGAEHQQRQRAHRHADGDGDHDVERRLVRRHHAEQHQQRRRTATAPAATGATATGVATMTSATAEAIKRRGRERRGGQLDDALGVGVDAGDDALVGQELGEQLHGHRGARPRPSAA